MEREAIAGVWAQVASTVADVTSALDTTVESNSRPVYRVRPVGFGGSLGPTSVPSVEVVTPAHFALLNDDQRRVYLLPGDALGVPRLLGVARGHSVKAPVGLSTRFSPRGPTEVVELYEAAVDIQVGFSLSRGKIAEDVNLDQTLDTARTGFARRIAGFEGTLVGVFGGTSLRRINADGTTALIGALTGPVGNEVVRALGFAGTTLYAGVSADGDSLAERLYAVDLATGALTLRGALGATGDLQALTGTQDPGFLFGTDGAPGIVSKLYRIDPVTGVATDLGSTGVTNVVGIAALELPHPDAPRVSRASPQTLATATATTVVLHGANLNGVNLSSLHPSVSVLSVYESATGRALVAKLRVSAGVSLGIPLLVSGGGRASVYVLDVIDASAPLVVGSGTTVELAGTVRLPALTVDAGGTLRGVGLEPLRLVVDGAVLIRGTVDASGFDSGLIDEVAPHLTVAGRKYLSGDGGMGGPGGGGGGGGGPTERTEQTVGGWGGGGLTGGSGGGSSPTEPAAAGGFGLGTSGALGQVGVVGTYGTGGAGGKIEAAGVPGGSQAPGGGGAGGTGDALGLGGPGGAVGNNPGPPGRGGGGGAFHTSNGCGGGGGGYGTNGNPGRLSGGSSTGGGPGGLAHGVAALSQLAGGSGGAGGCSRGDFEGIGGGGGGGGGAIAVIASHVEVSATGVLKADGGSNRTHKIHDGEGGGGSGGAIVVHAPTVDLKTGATVQALGGVVENQGTRGQGGVGRIRVDAVRYQRDGLDVAAGTFATLTQPTVGFMGSTPPTLTLPGAPTSNGALIELALQPNDPDTSQVALDVQFTSDAGATWHLARSSQVHDPLHGFPGALGATHTFRWDPRRDLPAGSYMVQLRARLVDARVGVWVASSAFPIVVN